MPPSLDEWLPQDHLARFVIAVVETLDLSAFYARRRTDGWGRAAYDPPDDGGPAHLRRVGLIALGSTRIQANASPGANRSAEWIRAEVERIIAEARATDEEEDRRLGDSTASHLPEDLIQPDARLGRLLAAKARLEADRARRQAAYEARVAAREAYTRRTGRGLTGRKPKPPEERAKDRDRSSWPTPPTPTAGPCPPPPAGSARGTTPRPSPPRTRSPSPARSPPRPPTSPN